MSYLEMGEPVSVVANGGSKIECDPNMKKEIEEPPINVPLFYYGVAQMYASGAAEMASVPSLKKRGKRFAKKVTVRDRVLTMSASQKKSSPMQKEALSLGSIFDPTEKEIVDILELKVSRAEFDLVKQIELYEHEPSELPSMAHDSSREKLYFLTLLRYLDRGVVNRQAKGGFWSIMEEPSDINNRDGNAVAKKTTLVYYMQGKHKASEPVKTNWRMEEYILLNSQDIEESSWAFCVVYLHSP
ncbi:NAC-domain protein [Melia azedarach]|uniref:NAC-domain protein n=1 Tax=Melia azedarach TaxID=155640 RepID=A0ACC1YCE9_MELAZ|nr:NAC-domain protein [Melia azedarach]